MTPGEPRLEPPDAATLAWVADQLGSAAVVVRRLGGGLDAATHLVRSVEGREAVLRRFTGLVEAWRHEELSRERDQLALLQGRSFPVAELLAHDLDAVRTDAPALLVSRLPGRLTYPRDPSPAFVAGLAAAAAMVHVQPVPALAWPWTDQATGLRGRLDAGEGPVWARLREVGVPDGPLTLVHGDLWPGNLLFEGDRLTGIVDWGSAGVGQPGMEIAYLAADLRVATGSEELHAAVIDAYEELGGPLTLRPWWEVAGYLRFPTDPSVWLDAWTEAGLPLSADDVRASHAAGLASALERLSSAVE